MQHPAYLDPSLRLIPAETSFLNSIVLTSQDNLYFLAGTGRGPTTDHGEICARVLGQYYAGKLAHSEVCLIPDFTVDAEQKTIPQPVNFLNQLEKLVGSIRKNAPDIAVLLNLTGGYKLGGMFGTLVGLKHGCRIYYMYDQMAHPIDMPVLTADYLVKLAAYTTAEKRRADVLKLLEDAYRLLTECESYQI